MTVKRMLRGDAPAVAQITRLKPPAGTGQISITVLGSGKVLMFDSWDPVAVSAAWNASAWPEFSEATASVDSITGTDVLLTSTLAGRPFYISATVGGNSFADEKQTIVPVNNVTGGAAKAIWLGQTTATFDPVTETAAGLKALFEALPGGIVASGELTWTGPTGGPWTVTFGGRYADQPVPLIVIDSSGLTGGTAAQDEKQRLSIGTAVDPCTFALRRPDTLQTTANLVTPVTASAVQAALSGIGYTTSCTGGPLTSAGSSYDIEDSLSSGYYGGSILVGNAFPQIGWSAAYSTMFTGLVLVPCAEAQGATIGTSLLRLTQNTVASTPPVAFTVRAYATDNAAWPSNEADAAAETLTTASASGSSAGYGSNVDIDVTSIVQELVNRPGWASGNLILFHLTPAATTNYVQFSPDSTLSTLVGASPITIEWTGPNADTNIPQLLMIGSGGYAGLPVIATIQDGSPATSPELLVELSVAGGESLIIRDDVRSRGPNHYDDPLNWEGSDGTFSVPQESEALFIETGDVSLLWGLKQRSEFIAIAPASRLRLTEVHHLWVGMAVELQTTGVLPAGLAVATTYYVVMIDGPYVQLSATSGGAPVAMTDAGTGVHTVGVKLISAEIQARWTGYLGLARNNALGTSSYFEYRERYLEIWCPAFRLGTGAGGSSNRINIDTGIDQTSIMAVSSGGQIETGVNAILWRGLNASNELQVMQGDLGVAIFPEESASFDSLLQYGGSVCLGRNVTGNTVQRTGGSTSSLGAVIANPIVLN